MSIETAMEFKRSLKRAALGTLLGTVGMVGLTTYLTPAANAQQRIPEALEDINNRRSGTYYENRSIFGQARFITGLGGFPDQRIDKDAEAFSEAYSELMMLQTQNTATVRVPDLPNPYSSSVQLLPTSQFNSRVIGSELNFEPLPRR